MDEYYLEEDGLMNEKVLKEWAADIPFWSMFSCAAYVLRYDQDLLIISGNSCFYELFGCTEEDMRLRCGNRLAALLDADSIRLFDKLALKSDRDLLQPVRMRLKIKRGNEAAWIQTAAFGCRSGDETLLYCLSIDATDEELARRTLATYREVVGTIADMVDFAAFSYDISTKTAEIYSENTALMELLQDDEIRNQGQVFNFEETVISSGCLESQGVSDFREAFAAARKNGSRVVCELRIKTRKNQVHWVRMALTSIQSIPEKEGQILGVMEDVTQQKEVSLNYLRETEFYQAILSEKDAYGQLDVTEDRLLKMGGIWNLYNEIINKVSYSQIIEQFINKVVHPDDRKHYLELMQRDNFLESLDNGIDRLGCEFRRIVEQNKMMWMEIHIHLFRDPFTNHVFGLLYLKNIDVRKKQELALLHDSRRDTLTNIFNRKMAETAIETYLKQAGPDMVCAFMILDLDDFKLTNDTYGHKTGDRVLIRLAEGLNSVFDKNDIVGRFGGDEFILLLKRAESVKQVESKVKLLYEWLNQEQSPRISCSIGITMPHGGDSYAEAFHKADTALYMVKKKAKGSFGFYENQEISEYEAAARDVLMDQIGECGDRNQNDFASFLAEQGDIAYLVDPDTFSLICGNQAFYDRLGMSETECLGLKCYEAVQKREAPCPFCSKANWSSDKFYIWKNFNVSLEQEFLIKNRLVQWKGREALLALAIDISNDKSIVDSIKSESSDSDYLLSGVQHMEEKETLNSALECAMEVIGYYFRADTVRFWKYRQEEISYTCACVWSGERKPPEYTNRELLEINDWLCKGKWAENITLENPETMICHSYHLYQHMNRNQIQNQRWIQLKDSDSVIGCISIDNITMNFQNVAFMESFSVFIINEIKKRQLMEAVMHAGEYDELTGVFNRSSYEKYFREYKGEFHKCIGVMTANMNNLREINLNKGHTMGNRYLVKFADMLKECFEGAEIFRLNGDEFLVVSLDTERVVMERKIKKLEELIGEYGAFTVSIGFVWDNGEKDLAVMIQQANSSMRIRKKNYYDSLMVMTDTGRHKMLGELMASLEKGNFLVYLQPKVVLGSNRVVGAEALIRYHDEKKGLIMPNQFIEILERNNFIRYIDLYVFEVVCRLLSEWKTRGKTLPVISLNFSRLTLLEPKLLSSMEDIISRYHVPRKLVEIEITESLSDMGKSVLFQTARDIYDSGYSVSLDDFGTKYTNLSILNDINFDTLKLDKSLVDSLDERRKNQIILKNIIYMCGDLGIKVIAEGIETRRQEEILRAMSCEQGQGYLYGKPMPIREFERRYINIE